MDLPRTVRIPATGKRKTPQSAESTPEKDKSKKKKEEDTSKSDDNDDDDGNKTAAKEGKGGAAVKGRRPLKEYAPAGLMSPPKIIWSEYHMIRFYKKGDTKEVKEPSSANTDSTSIPPAISPSQKYKAKSEEGKRQKPSVAVVMIMGQSGDSLTEEQRKEKDIEKKPFEKINNFLNALLLRPENVQSHPIAAATPTSEAKEWLMRQLELDRKRIDSWFYRKRKKLKKQHVAVQASNHPMTAAGDMTLPQPQTQAIPVPAIDIAKPPSISKNRFIMNPNLNLPSNHQTALIAGTQVSMSINQQLPSTVQNSVAVGEGLSPQTSTKGVGLSDEAKQYLTRWLLTSSNPYLSKD